jgi:hypothetical protein
MCRPYFFYFLNGWLNCGEKKRKRRRCVPAVAEKRRPREFAGQMGRNMLIFAADYRDRKKMGSVFVNFFQEALLSRSIYRLAQ